MNAVILFLLSLCSVWFQPADQSLMHFAEKTQHVQFSNQNQVIVKTLTAVNKKIEFSNLEDEDEDDDQSLSSKYVLLTKCFFALAFSASLISPFSHLDNRLPFSRHIYKTSSPKYILQRVLRL